MSGVFDFDPDRFIERQAAPAAVVPLRQMPDEWQHGLALLGDRLVPEGANPDRWAQVVADARRIATVYLDEVLKAAWSIENLFGFDPDEPSGFMGLAVAMRGGE